MNHLHCLRGTLARVALAFAVLTTGSALAQRSPDGASAARAPGAGPTVHFTDTRLANGLRVIVSEDHAAPVVSVAVTYDVGSRNERPGRTGLAHLFEHLMFGGSARVGAGEHMALVTNNGGRWNASTNKDRTNYYEQLPANQLDLALFLEADRMRGLEITQKTLNNQISVVAEERRQRYDNVPYGRTDEAVADLAYTNFAYRHSTVGSVDDVRGTTLEAVTEFFQTYYAPNNAVVAVVGDVKADECLAKVRNHFESIPRRAPAAPADMTELPQAAEKRLTLEDARARQPQLAIAYKIPPSMTADNDALDVLASVLGSGRSSRLYERVVRQKALAATVSAFVPESRGPGLFRITAMAPWDQSVADVEKAIDEEIERLKTGPIDAWEIDKARNSALRFFVATVRSSMTRAMLLSQLAVYYGRPDAINTRYEQVRSVSAADVQRVARQYLTARNRTVVVTNPKRATARPTPAPAKKGGL